MDQKTSNLTLVTALGDMAQKVDIQDRNERQSVPGLYSGWHRTQVKDEWI